MMGGRCLFVLTLALVSVSAQKLYFKSNRLLQDGKKQHNQVSADVIVCPGNKSACPKGNICCLTTSMAYDCCPLPMAVCCPDNRHCCPSGTRCDLSVKACIRDETVVPWFKKTLAISLDGNNYEKDKSSINMEIVVCPDGSYCLDGQTCCKTGGTYGCCPLPNAVCCSDGVHCCPSGYICDGSCRKQDTGEVINRLEKVSPKKTLQQVGGLQQISTALLSPESESVRCDDKHVCPTGNTCCRMEDNEWGCCPKPKAVCCSDLVHCCPSGYTCDVSAGKCNHGEVQLDWFLKTRAIIKLRDVICPDGSECPSDQTCCKLLGVSSYGCCPLPNAVCCSDGEHCCPQGYKCDLSASSCVRGIMELPWIRPKKQNNYTESHKTESIDTVVQRKNDRINSKGSDKELQEVKVQCPDGMQCPAEYSCCDNGKGGYNCCPLLNAVCCEDHQHCCPHGYICDEEPGICRIPETSAAASNLIRKLAVRRGTPHA